MFFSVLSLFALSSMAMERMDSNSAALLPLSLLLILLVLLLLPLFFSANFWRSLTASGLTWYPWLSARVIARLTFEDAEELKGERAGTLLFLLAIYLSIPGRTCKGHSVLQEFARLPLVRGLYVHAHLFLGARAAEHEPGAVPKADLGPVHAVYALDALAVFLLHCGAQRVVVKLREQGEVLLEVEVLWDRGDRLAQGETVLREVLREHDPGVDPVLPVAPAGIDGLARLAGKDPGALVEFLEGLPQS